MTIPGSSFFTGKPMVCFPKFVSSKTNKLEKTNLCPNEKNIFFTSNIYRISTSIYSSRNKHIYCAFNAKSTRERAQTPHSGYHLDGLNRRFFEGWYFRVVLPGEGNSFAFMYSIEDPISQSQFSGVGAQVMGPGDGYLVQHSRLVKPFWGERSRLALGNCFEPVAGQGGQAPKRLVSEDLFFKSVEEGFQVGALQHQGALMNRPGSVGPGPKSTATSCKWSYTTRPVYGWGGGVDSKQLSTAGWLAALPVFEPHWQVLMSKGLSTGWIEWDDKRFEFEDAPTYSEKNWGGAFPLKWFWVQCNSFSDTEDLSVTAGGGRRELPFLPGATENVALIGVHYRGEFIGLVPWEGVIQWEIAPWGSWEVSGSSSKWHVQLSASCQADVGTKLRAPTVDMGLAGFCKDTFSGNLNLRIWKNSAGQRGELVVDAKSTQAALEVGGGPWWESWKETAEMKEPFRTFLNSPLPIEDILEEIPSVLRPPGL